VNLLIREMRVSIDRIVPDHRDHRSSCRHAPNRYCFPSPTTKIMKPSLLRILPMLDAAELFLLIGGGTAKAFRFKRALAQYSLFFRRR
jgi:hypothetical protein